jgi:inositol phosphorylceramide mannosyltransferase catalytic subunit
MVRLWAKVLLLASVFILSFPWWRPILKDAYALALLPIRWHASSADSVISEQRDAFDVTFASYPINHSTSESGPSYPIPPILHHIHLGKNGLRPEWLEARSNCLRYHETWQAHFWDDDNSSQFVEENFPHLKEMWDSYQYPVQRVDALRYMLLYKFGGEVHWS